MTASNVSLRHLILGLLTREAMSGYDIKRFLKSLSWLVGSPSFGSLYPALRALLQDGLVTESSDPHENKRVRKVYSITEAGKRALQDWVNRPVAPDASLKSFVMRLVLAGNFPRVGLITHLQQRRSQVAIHLATLEQITGAPHEEGEWQQRLALDYGLTLAAAELAWLDSTLNRLFQPLPMEVVQGEGATSEV
jgi:PadR family transcriptional regulator AphA